MKKAFLYIVLAGVLWGTSGLFVHALSPLGFTSMQMTAMRGGVAALAMTGFSLWKDKSVFRVCPKALCMFALSGWSIFGTAYFYFSSIAAATVSVAVMLMYTAPVFVLLFSVAFLGEKMTKTKLLAVGLVLVGCVLVSGVLDGMQYSVRGLVLGLLSALCYSSYNILTKIEMMRGYSSVSATMYSFIAMGLAAVLSCRPAELFRLAGAQPQKSIPLIVGIGVVTCVLPYVFYTLALKELPAGTASALSIVEPLSATVFSVIFLTEKLSAASACGIVLILTAIVLLGRSKQ